MGPLDGDPSSLDPVLVALFIAYLLPWTSVTLAVMSSSVPEWGQGTVCPCECMFVCVCVSECMCMSDLCVSVHMFVSVCLSVCADGYGPPRQAAILLSSATLTDRAVGV